MGRLERRGHDPLSVLRQRPRWRGSPPLGPSRHIARHDRTREPPGPPLRLRRRWRHRRRRILRRDRPREVHRPAIGPRRRLLDRRHRTRRLSRRLRGQPAAVVQARAPAPGRRHQGRIWSCGRFEARCAGTAGWRDVLGDWRHGRDGCWRVRLGGASSPRGRRAQRPPDHRSGAARALERDGRARGWAGAPHGPVGRALLHALGLDASDVRGWRRRAGHERGGSSGGGQRLLVRPELRRLRHGPRRGRRGLGLAMLLRLRDCQRHGWKGEERCAPCGSQTNGDGGYTLRWR
jgi:hypothetical protein